MKIAILDDYQDAVRQLHCLKLLDNHEVKIFSSSARGVGQQAIRFAPFDVLVLIRERSSMSGALLSRLPNLKLIAQTGAVGAHIDLDAATRRGVVVAEGFGSKVAPAELTWALIMAASRKVIPYANNLKDGLWQTASINPQLNGLGRSLSGRTLSIWGYGKIGRLVAGYGRAFGMHVLVWGSAASREAARFDGFGVAETRAALFEQADVLSLHLRLADSTRAAVTGADFARMKPDALFVNSSRAALVEEGALEAALHLGRPGCAAVDVFDSEPLAPQAALLRIPTVLATPHLGYVEQDSYEIMFEAAFRNIVNFAAGTPSNIVNPAALAAKPAE